MSKGSSLRGLRARTEGLPVTKKEKLRIATFALIKIAMGDKYAQDTANRALDILGIKPKGKIHENSNNPTDTLQQAPSGQPAPGSAEPTRTNGV